MSLIGSLRRRMPGITFGNLLTGETKELSVVPAELTESITVEYAKKSVVGLAHRPMHYIGTENHAFPQLTFKYVATSPAQRDRMDDERRFMLSLCYPTEAVDGVLRGGPPRTLFVWPGLVAMTVLLTSVRFDHLRFNSGGEPVETNMIIIFEEARDVRLSSAEVREQGTIRR